MRPYKTQMGTILLRIVPIHFQVTGVTFRARLRLLQPAFSDSCESESALNLRFNLLQLNF